MSSEKKIEDGGPAFPQHPESECVPKHMRGLSIRDYFAGQAMEGFCSANAVDYVVRNLGSLNRQNVLEALSVVANACYATADAMLAARKAGGGA